MIEFARRRTDALTQLAEREPSPAGLYDLYAHELLALAQLLLDDHREAEQIVVQAFREPSPRPRAGGNGDDRRRLAAEVHRRCFSARSAHGPVLCRIATDTDPSPVHRALTSLSDQQRSVIGLCLFGGHTHTQAASFLRLPVWVIDELLRSGLHRLSAAS